MSTINERVTRCRWIGVLALWLATPAVATEDYRAQVDAYVAEARQANLALRGAGQALRGAEADLVAAEARWRPTVTLSSRYSRAEGGRVEELPVGDLVNPAYSALNELLVAQGQPPRFGAIPNQTLAFLREREQDSRLSLTQPLYAPAINAGQVAAAAGVAAAGAVEDALASSLERDVEVAYLRWLQAREALAIVEASRELLLENLRVNRVLEANGKLTRDQVLRAEAEVLAIEQEALTAGNAIAQARSLFNTLLNRPLDAEISAAAVPDPDAEVRRRLGALAEADAADLTPRAQQARAELAAFAGRVRAAEAGVAAERAARQPTLAFALDAGIQGEDYGFGSGANYAVASLVLDWRLADFGQTRGAIDSAAARLEQERLAREDLAERIALEVRLAADGLKTARASLATAAARQVAAAEGFRIAARKRDVGAIPQVEYLDARTTLTAAELNLNLTRFAVLVRLAELQAALGRGGAGAP
jgi:outer membrane protein TolC